MKLHRLLPCLALGLLASACSSAQVTTQAGRAPDRFQQALADGYKKWGDEQSSEADPVAQRILYGKAAASMNGEVVPVGDPLEWQEARGLAWRVWLHVTGFEGRMLATANDYRARLVPWVEATKGRDPVGAAGMQTNFECWLEEMSEDEFEDAPHCGFNPDGLTIVQAQTTVTQAAPAPAPVAMPPKTYLVFFDFDRSEITPEAASIIRQAAADAKRGNVRLIVATGHADRSGSDEYNQRLSERRANAVKGALIREGIAAGTIQTVGRGEGDPLVQTPDGVREPRNRRVEISFR